MEFTPLILVSGLLALLVASFIFLIFEIYVVIIGHLKGAPFVKSSRRRIEAMLDAADIQDGEMVLDLGSGDGTLLIEAGKRGARAVGFDINPFLVWYSRMRAKWAGLDGRVEIFKEDFRSRSLNGADVVFLYLWPETLEKLQAKLSLELKPGARVISNAFPIPGWKHEKEQEQVYLYVR